MLISFINSQEHYLKIRRLEIDIFVHIEAYFVFHYQLIRGD